MYEAPLRYNPPDESRGRDTQRSVFLNFLKLKAEVLYETISYN